jgi:hypothetical protein
VTYVRHASRKLAWTFERNLRASLDSLGWITPPIAFSTTPVTITTRRIPESEMQAITGNLVGVFFGAETDDAPFQLGGGYQVTSHQVFVDIVAVNEAVGLALAGDIKDVLSGRVPGKSRYFNLRDYDTDPGGILLPDWQVEVVEVERQRPDNNQVKLFWQVLVASLEMTFPGDE